MPIRHAVRLHTQGCCHVSLCAIVLLAFMCVSPHQAIAQDLPSKYSCLKWMKGFYEPDSEADGNFEVNLDAAGAGEIIDGKGKRLRLLQKLTKTDGDVLFVSDGLLVEVEIDTSTGRGKEYMNETHMYDLVCKKE